MGPKSAVLQPIAKNVADGGGTISTEIGGTLRHISILPIGTSIPLTTVQADLLDRQNNLLMQIVPQDQAGSDANGYPNAVVWHGELPLTEDIPIILRVVVYNLTGSSVKWQVTTVTEEVE